MPLSAPDGNVVWEVPLGLIDLPAHLMRETMDEEKLAGLTESVRRFGVLLPIRVQANGERYTLCDGARRYTASLRAGKGTIPAIVTEPGEVSGEMVKVQCNLWREDVPPLEEAGYLRELLKVECGEDVDKLSELTGLTRNYIDARLMLLKYDEEVQAAIRANEISLAVGRALMRFRDRALRMMYLDAARRGGATERMVNEWRATAERLQEFCPTAPDSGDGSNQHTGKLPPTTTMCCFFCGTSEAPWEMQLLYLHRQCEVFVRARLGCSTSTE